MLVDAGYRVTSIIRNPDHAGDVAQTGATPRVADVENLDDAGTDELLCGFDAVVWSAGAGGGNPARTYAVDRDAAIRSMDSAARSGVTRYVMVSYFGAGTDDGVDPSNSFFHYAEAKAAADAHLTASNLDWTILKPSRLTLDEPTGRISVGGSAQSVSRGDVAATIVAALDHDTTIGRQYAYNNGDELITDAIR
ncbi:SDR family oxidoreductase [Skermania sp. ID1734]|uniref:SDR family oxidoreductase n=1 Tax=Skermania sp. ID1734 TaxID=2597516 RepID=UPI00117EB052|nr:SDR family oxidoreductase [Skermania sp. ID1734]TSD96130.1 SDR family oxidoreductase [Skermania sp. ID1734]